MVEIFGRVSKHVAVVEYSVVMCTAWPTSNIICDAVHAITHNKCTQQIAIFAKKRSLLHLLSVVHR